MLRLKSSTFRGVLVASAMAGWFGVAAAREGEECVPTNETSRPAASVAQAGCWGPAEIEHTPFGTGVGDQHGPADLSTAGLVRGLHGPLGETEAQQPDGALLGADRGHAAEDTRSRDLDQQLLGLYPRNGQSRHDAARLALASSSVEATRQAQPSGPAPTDPTTGRPPGALFSENFDDPDSAWCKTGVVLPEGLTFECNAGEWVIRGTFSGHRQWTSSVGRYANASLALDARLTGGSEGRYFVLVCRDQGVASANRYEFVVIPSLQRFSLGRSVNGEWEMRVGPGESAAIKPGNETNRLELTCAGDRITAYANGEELGSFQDGTFRAGLMWFGVGNVTDGPLPVQGNFDNVTVTER
ncbi:MAG: hypothetical protein U0821_02505 [Chloroflexota bacterium]